MWFILIVLIAASLAVAFLPRLKGFRTLAFGFMTSAWAFVLPLLAQVFEYLKAVDWTQYVEREQAPWIVLALTLTFMVLRFMTTSAVGRK